MRVKAKFRVNSVNHIDYGQVIELNAVYSSVPDSEDKHFSDATPSGKLQFTLTNKSLFDQFKPGQVYYLTMDEAV
jgi:hypothetical protein